MPTIELPEQPPGPLPFPKATAFDRHASRVAAILLEQVYANQAFHAAGLLVAIHAAYRMGYDHARRAMRGGQ